MPTTSRFLAALLLLAAPLPAAGSGIKHESADLTFAYDWPDLPADVPGLEAHLRAEAAAEAARAEQEAARIRAEDRQGDEAADPPHHSYDKGWTATITPSLLSLAASVTIYQGGAHEAHGYDSLIWDRRRDAALGLSELFADPARAMQRLETDYCRALKVEIRSRRGAETEDMPACPPLAGVPVALVASHGKGIDTLEVLLAPYAVGSFAEGPYEVDLAIPRAVRRLVRPAYRADFAR